MFNIIPPKKNGELQFFIHNKMYINFNNVINLLKGSLSTFYIIFLCPVR